MNYLWLPSHQLFAFSTRFLALEQLQEDLRKLTSQIKFSFFMSRKVTCETIDSVEIPVINLYSDLFSFAPIIPIVAHCVDAVVICDGADAMRAILLEELVGVLSSVNVTVLVESGIPVVAPLLNEKSVSVTVNVFLTQSEVLMGDGDGGRG